MDKQQTLLDDKIEQATLGEPTYNETKAKAINLENHIVVAGLEFLDLNMEQNGIIKQLKEMQKGACMYLWPKLTYFAPK